MWMRYLSNSIYSTTIRQTRLIGLLLSICLVAMIENRLFVYYFSGDRWPLAFNSFIYFILTLIPDSILFLVVCMIITRSHWQSFYLNFGYTIFSVILICGIILTSTINMQMFLVTGRPIHWLVVFQLDRVSRSTLMWPHIPSFLMILLSQIILGTLLSASVNNFLRRWFIYPRIFSKVAFLAIICLMAMALNRIPITWKALSSNTFLELISTIISSNYKQTSSIEIDQNDKLFDYVSSMIKAPSVNFSEPITTLKKPIKHVFMIYIESLRADVLPLDPNFAQTFGREFRSPFTTKDISPLLDSLWSKSVHGTASTVSCYTLKSLLGILCGMYPLTTNFLEEVLPEHSWYQQCLPNLLRQYLPSTKFRSAFFTASRDNFDRQRDFIDRMHFDASFNGFHAENQTDFKGNLGIFGPEDPTIIPLLWKWIDQTLIEDSDQQLFINLLTTDSHFPFSIPTKENNEQFKEYIDMHMVNQYLNTIRMTDQLLEGIIDGMKKRGIYDQTLFIFVGDHGHVFNDREHRQFGTYEVTLESAFAVPLMFFNSQLQAQELQGSISTMDILPTIMDILFSSQSTSTNLLLSPMTEQWENVLLKYEGRSLLRRPISGQSERYTFHLSNPGNIHFIAKQYPCKLTYNVKTDSVSVYHLQHDPYEKIDLIALDTKPLIDYPTWLIIDPNRQSSRIWKDRWYSNRLLSLSLLQEERYQAIKSVENSHQISLEDILNWANKTLELTLAWSLLMKTRYRNVNNHRLFSL